MRQVFQLDPLGYPTELYTQTPDEDGEYPALTEEQTAIPPPEGMYRRRFDRKRQTWVDEVTEAELYEMAYREKHRELVQAATEEFVAAKPGYTEMERCLQTLRDMHGMIRQLEQRLREVYPDAAPVEALGFSGDEESLTNIFDALYDKLVMLEQTRQTQDREKVEALKWS